MPALGAIGFESATRTLPCRDAWIGWQDQAYKKHLNRLVCNHRFLIFPWVRVQGLASKALSQALRRLPDDWQAQHGVRPVLVETFVDTEKFQGTAYRAANWQKIGQTTKQKGKSIKDVYVYPLSKPCRTLLKDGPGKPRPRPKSRP